MNKQIFFSLLLLTNISLHGMKRSDGVNDTVENVLFNPDLMPTITEGLYTNHKYNPQTLKHDISALAYSCKFLHHYFTQEKIAQNIIRSCSLYNKSNDKDVAHILGCHTIEKKIKYFTDIALDENLNEYKEFTSDNLKDEWYLSMHTSFFSDFLQKSLQQPLIQVALNHSKLNKVLLILDHVKEFNFYHNKEKNILLNIAENRYCLYTYNIFMEQKKYAQLLTIAERLLQKNIPVDDRKTTSQYTPLMYAITKKDTSLVRLLLTYSADLNAEYHNVYTGKIKKAFHLTDDKQWLKKIIDEAKVSKNLK